MKLVDVIALQYKIKLTILIIFCMIILYYNDIYLKSQKLGPFSLNKSTVINSTKTIMRFYKGINEAKVYSKNFEDGVTQYFIDYFKIDPGVYFEVRAGLGLECNTRILRENLGWTGLLIDPSFEDNKINLKKAEVSPNNVLELLEKFNIGSKLDFIAIETDYAGNLYIC